MSKEDSNTIKYTLLILNFLEKILNSKIVISGKENISNNPSLFIANHFTRSETFILPYILYKIKNKKVKCLADNNLFKGFLGKLLNDIGAIPTDSPNRNETIISNLAKNKANWIIYPEGGMVKSKKVIIKRNKILIDSEAGLIDMYTGFSVFALQSQLNNNYKKNVKIIPTNISYHPIRPQDNNIKKILKKFIDKIPKSLEKELELEGNILLNSKIHINFGKAIDVKDYINHHKYKFIINKSPENIIKKLRHKLTYDAMTKVYENIEINFDHLFAALIFMHKKPEIDINELKKSIFLLATQIAKNNYKIDSNLELKNLIKIITDDEFLPFIDIKDFSIKQRLISQKKDKIIINREKLFMKYKYNEIANKNILQILANEILSLPKLKKLIIKISKKNSKKITKEIFKHLYKFDLNLFEQKYQQFYKAGVSKKKDVGKPLFLSHKNNKYAVILCHGYLSAPKEMQYLAQQIHLNNFDTYSIRLEGHGTSPDNLKSISWQDWLFSISRTYGSLKNKYQKIFLIGFSTGGLLSLLAAAKIAQECHGVICINSALKLQDIRFRFAGPVKYWNELMGFFNIKKAKLEFIENNPEKPEVNYNKNYLHSIIELRKLMDQTSESLKNITIPTFIIHSDNDPIVNPESGNIIYDKINSKNKKLEFIKSHHHVITEDHHLTEKILKILDNNK